MILNNFRASRNFENFVHRIFTTKRVLILFFLCLRFDQHTHIYTRCGGRRKINSTADELYEELVLIRFLPVSVFHQVRPRDIASDIFITNLSASVESLFMLFEIRNTRKRIRSLRGRGEARCT